jgi:hypothetical protein
MHRRRVLITRRILPFRGSTVFGEVRNGLATILHEMVGTRVQ